MPDVDVQTTTCFRSVPSWRIPPLYTFRLRFPTMAIESVVQMAMGILYHHGGTRARLLNAMNQSLIMCLLNTRVGIPNA